MALPATPLKFSTALSLQEKLVSGSLTSRQLIEACLQQIESHNGVLNALISVCPEHNALIRADDLDKERREGYVRSRLHGIPVVVKDTFITHKDLGLPTTAGAHAFASMTALKNASLIEKLLHAGLIIIGKGNMTEFCGLKSNDTPVGWSAFGGQTKSPYRRDDLSEDEQPIAGGSSSGSAVSIASGFCPLAIGTETSGSTVYPASLSGLYALKLTPGLIPTDGVFKLSSSFDGIGLMARDPRDLAALAEILVGIQTDSPLVNLPTFEVSCSWEGLSVGIADVLWGIHETGTDKWGHPHVRASWKDAVDRMCGAGARVVYPIDLPAYDTVTHDKQTLHTIAYHEFPSQVKEFAGNFDPETGDVRTLGDIIAWNKDHADEALPPPHTTQTELEAALVAATAMTEDEHQAAVSEIRRLAGIDGLGRAMREAQVDVIVSASDSIVVGFAGAAGWPIATVPLGNLETNGQPFGLFVIAPEGREDLLFRFMGAFYATFPAIEKPAEF
ncbi:putative amidase [Colletotrichum gloeosporioides]|uniref:Putative amidase n=1 Tax=Colletotrichum gloeosporioides TaxID=474922 RepID=A0A8H4FD82_COLGL|nr:putative amidase [Colletotrichum gloeosporioides]KAF3797676.1 putative amidase [Colletotrichum gloeosporioides]